jgi:hypothetical protein
MFQLTAEEFAALRYQFGTSNVRAGRGGRRSQPYAFTEHGVAMLAAVLNSRKAVLVSIEIVRTFVRLRRFLDKHRDLAERLAALEKKYDRQFAVVFEAIRRLIATPKRRKRIGFREP